MLSNINVHSPIEEAVQLGILSSEQDLSALRKMTPLDLCKEMKSYLCDEETSGPAIHVLAQASIKREHLCEGQLCVIINFLCEKAIKPKLTGAALSGLRSIVDDLLPKQECTLALFETLMNSLITKVPFQNLRLPVRKDGFAIICFIINKNTIGSCRAGHLRALLEAMDGEADPILVNDFFQLCKLILTYAKQEELHPVAQNYFDSLAAYFPVVFTPPQKCPVTKKDLQRGLSVCLSDQALLGSSIPFFISKLSSPSMVVRLESIETLETIVDTCPNHVGKKYFLDIILHTRNEIIKVCLYPQYEDNPSAKSFISLCFGLLKNISKKCGNETAQLALEVFAPVNEGVISSINSESSLCSVYATMLYHILTGSLLCGVACGVHLFTMLCAEEEENHPSSVCLLLSAVCSGLADSLRAFARDDDKETAKLKSSIRRPLLERLLSLVRNCGHQIMGNLIQDAFSAGCVVEFLASFFRLSGELAPCVGKSDTEFVLHALLHASVSVDSPHLASSKASMLVCNIIPPETDNLVEVIREKLIENPVPGASADRVLSFLEGVACVSLQNALFVINECFLGKFVPAKSWQTDLTEVQRSGAVLHILDNIDILDDDTAIDLLKKLAANGEKSLHYFKCFFTLFSRTSEAFHETIHKDLDQHPLVVAAALVCSSTSVLCRDYHKQAKHLLHRFDELTRTSQSPMRKMVAMNGISGVISTSTLSYDELSNFLSEASVGVATHVAALWGMCFSSSSAENSDSTAEIITSSLSNLLLTASEDEVLEALSFSPIQLVTAASKMGRNLLSCYVSIDIDSVVSLHVYWKGALCLVKAESAGAQPISEAHFLERLHQGCRVGVKTELLRQILYAFMEKQPPATLVVKELLLSPTLLGFVLEGLRSERLVNRCEALSLLSSFSAFVATEQHSANNPFRKARDIILNAIQLCLNDKKRKVRRAAAHCRHMWCNIN